MKHLSDDELQLSLDRLLDMFCHAHGVKLKPDRDNNFPIIIQRNVEEPWNCYNFEVRK